MIVYTRNGREFVKTGSLPPGTRSVRISIDGRVGASIWKVKKALAVVSEAIETGHAHADKYEIVEVAVDPPRLVASRIANLNKARNRKSLIGKLRAGSRFFIQQSKGGRYSIGDALNHDTEMFPGRFETETEAQRFIDEFLAEP
jgi:hypothetical protein